MAIVTQTLAADGETAAVALTPIRKDVPATVDVHVYGDFGGGTATVQVSPDSGTTWYAATDSAGEVEFTADGAAKLEYNSDAQAPLLARISLASSTAPDLDIKWFIKG